MTTESRNDNTSNTANAGAKPKHSKEITLIASNLTLLILAGTFLWFAVSSYQKQIETVSLNENRFLTVEWHLLQTMKTQTENQLLEKDREIADLRGRSQRLAQAEGSTEALKELEEQLLRAQQERDLIVAQRLSGAVNQTLTYEPDQVTVSAKPVDQIAITSNTDEVLRLLREHVKNLETQSQDYARLFAENRETAERQAEVIADLRTKLESALRAATPAAGTETAADAGLMGAIENTQSELRQKTDKLKTRTAPSVEALNNRALVRALLNSPEVRAKHPDILSAFDTFFEQYGTEKQEQGQRDAYNDVLKTIDALLESAQKK